MAQFERIDIETAIVLVEQQGAVFVDVRDEDAFNSAHVPGAIHLSNTSLQDFIDDTATDIPVVVYCYHGNSSQSAAAYLCEKGFQRTYSMDGGFEHWRISKPITQK